MGGRDVWAVSWATVVFTAQKGRGRAHTFASLTCSQIFPGRGGPRLAPNTPALHPDQIFLDLRTNVGPKPPRYCPHPLAPNAAEHCLSISSYGPIFTPIKSQLCSNCGRVGSMCRAGEGPKQRSWVYARDLSWGHWAREQGQTSPTALAKREEGCSPQIRIV